MLMLEAAAFALPRYVPIDRIIMAPMMMPITRPMIETMSAAVAIPPCPFDLATIERMSDTMRRTTPAP